ncbi:hypothetical protein R1sor_022287 [Riccia sorocarpa]|uniref:PGRL1A transmembrane protein n=1 Tax=Riccia sorocarpa TaxID=122646 RepID=A0ABD3GN83_9MARC
MGVAIRLLTPDLHAAASGPLWQTIIRTATSSSCSSSCFTSLHLPFNLRSSSSCRLPSLVLSHRRFEVPLKTVMQASEGTSGPVKEDEEVIDNKILQYCSIDKQKSKRSIGELEQEFLEALQSFYYEGKPIMSNEEFDNLKEELMWEGSNIVMLSSDEQKFLEASLAYAAGNPILTDAQYDDLKIKLKKQGSQVAIGGPRCSLRSRKVVSDSTVDYLKMTLLNVPAALVALTLVFFLDDLTGFEITYLLELPEPYSFLFTWFILLPVTYLIAQALTGVIVKDPLILKGPCPSCGEQVTTFFGTILTVPSGGSVNNVQCESCKANLLFDVETRLITLDPTPSKDKKEKKASKKVASSS